MNVRMQHIAIKHHVKKKRTASAIFISRDGNRKDFKLFKIIFFYDFFFFFNLRQKYFGNAMQIM